MPARPGRGKAFEPNSRSQQSADTMTIRGGLR
jgi:hypothetical protein